MTKVFLLVFFLARLSFAQSPLSENWQMKADSLKSQDEAAFHELIEQVLNHAEKANDDELKRLALMKQVECLILFNHYDRADSLLQTMRPAQTSEPLYIDYLMAKGKVANQLQANDQALEFFYRILEINTAQTREYKTAETYLEIANVLRANNDLENCTRYFRFAMSQAKKDDNTALQVKACTQLCKVYNGWITLDLDSSVFYGEKAITIAREARDEYSYAHAISIAAAPIIRIGQYQRGLDMSKEALSFADKYNFTRRTQYYLVANHAFAFNDLMMYDSAIYYMNQAGELRPESIDQHRLKYRILKAQGKFKEAMASLEIYQQEFSKTVSNRHKSDLSSLQARYEANLKEQEVASLVQKGQVQEQQLRQQRYVLTGSILLVLILSGGSFLLVRQRQLAKQQILTTLELDETKKRLAIERQYRESELKALRSQMNPHFVFNALNSIQEYIMTNEKNLAGVYLGKFADLMRIYLNQSKVREISIEEEIAALTLYLDLEKMRFDDKLDYTLTIDEQIDKDTKIPSLLAQPYVENAIKHGLLHKTDNRLLNIELSINEAHELVFMIEDNGVGRKKSEMINKVRPKRHQSFATSATRNRLTLLNAERLHPILEVIQDLHDDQGEPCGTRVILKIPL